MVKLKVEMRAEIEIALDLLTLLSWRGCNDVLHTQKDNLAHRYMYVNLAPVHLCSFSRQSHLAF